MNSIDITADVRDFLRGYVKHHPENLAFVRNYPYWCEAADEVLKSRAVCFVDRLPLVAVQAISQGHISLARLARDLPG